MNDSERAAFWERAAKEHEAAATYYQQQLVDAHALVGRLLLGGLFLYLGLSKVAHQAQTTGSATVHPAPSRTPDMMAPGFGGSRVSSGGSHACNNGGSHASTGGSHMNTGGGRMSPGGGGHTSPPSRPH